MKHIYYTTTPDTKEDTRTAEQQLPRTGYLLTKEIIAQQGVKSHYTKGWTLIDRETGEFIVPHIYRNLKSIKQNYKVDIEEMIDIYNKNQTPPPPMKSNRKRKDTLTEIKKEIKDTQEANGIVNHASLKFTSLKKFIERHEERSNALREIQKLIKETNNNQKK